MRIYQRIAQLLTAISNCRESGNAEWQDRHALRLRTLMRETAPSGSGIDCGTKLMGDSTPEKLRFAVDFHHMNEGGMYDGWTEHVVTVRPSLAFNITLSISGRDRAGIKEYLGDTMHYWLMTQIDDLPEHVRAEVQ